MMRGNGSLAVAALIFLAACSGKSRPFGEGVPDTEASPGPDGAVPGATSVTPESGIADDAASGEIPLGKEGLPAVGEVQSGDAVSGQGNASCAGDAGSCASPDDPGSACVITGPRDCTSDADNDCDGQPDNVLDDVCVCVPESVEPCGEHPGLDGRGQCRAGSRTCILGEGYLTSDWGACDGSVGPGDQDSCSIVGDDTDCDGTNNGGCPCVEGEPRPCGPDNENGICRSGTQTCINGAFGACVGAVFAAPRNCASTQDNDCDGRADNTIDNVCTCLIGSVQACGTHPGRDGNGQCRAGSQSCEGRSNSATSTFGTCSGSVGPALQDTCADGNDGNCNGIPNEGCACINGQTRSCGPDVEVGLCRRGTQTCSNGFFAACQGAVFPAPRNCASTQDNDCDGRPDNCGAGQVCNAQGVCVEAARLAGVPAQVPGISFGTLLVPSSTTATWQVTNTGGSATGVLSSAETPNSSDFSVNTLNCPALGPGESCSVIVTFSPQSSGAKSTTLSLQASNGGSVVRLNVSGTGQQRVLVGESNTLPETQNYSPNFLTARRVTVAATAQLSNFGVITRQGGSQARIGLYRNTGEFPTERPAERVAQTGATLLQTGRQEIPIAPVQLAAGDYWIVTQFDASTPIATDNDSFVTAPYVAEQVSFNAGLPANFLTAGTVLADALPRANFFLVLLQ
jgi:hypothetical protein